MSYVIAAPEIMTAAATDLATIGSDLSAAHTAAAPATLAVTPAAADEVSTGIAQLFSQHAQHYHALAGQAAAFQDQFVQNLKTSAGSFASVEAACASFLLHLAGLPPGHIGQILGIPPGQLKKIPFIHGHRNPFFGIPPGHWRDLAPVPNPSGEAANASLLHLAGLPPGHIGQILGIPPGQLKKIPFIHGCPNPFFGIPPGHWRDLAPVPTPY